MQKLVESVYTQTRMAVFFWRQAQAPAAHAAARLWVYHHPHPRQAQAPAANAAARLIHQTNQIRQTSFSFSQKRDCAH